MLDFLQVVTEISESSNITEGSIDCKTLQPPLNSQESTMSSIIRSKKERDNFIALLRGKIKRIELANTNTLRVAENIHKKKEYLNEVRKYHEDFQENFQEHKLENIVKLEVKKMKIKYFNKTSKENIIKNKEEVQRKKSNSRRQVLKERSENEDYIRRREAFYLREAKEVRNKEQMRARSVASRDRSMKQNKHERVSFV